MCLLVCSRRAIWECIPGQFRRRRCRVLPPCRVTGLVYYPEPNPDLCGPATQYIPYRRPTYELPGCSLALPRQAPQPVAVKDPVGALAGYLVTWHLVVRDCVLSCCCRSQCSCLRTIICQFHAVFRSAWFGGRR